MEPGKRVATASFKRNSASRCAVHVLHPILDGNDGVVDHRRHRDDRITLPRQGVRHQNQYCTGVSQWQKTRTRLHPSQLRKDTAGEHITVTSKKYFFRVMYLSPLWKFLGTSCAANLQQHLQNDVFQRTRLSEMARITGPGPRSCIVPARRSGGALHTL